MGLGFRFCLFCVQFVRILLCLRGVFSQDHLFVIFFLSALLFDTASVVLPLIVTVSGKVGSDRPIKFKSSNLQPVILHETVK